jgi:hypothetical protein
MTMHKYMHKYMHMHVLRVHVVSSVERPRSRTPADAHCRAHVCAHEQT